MSSFRLDEREKAKQFAGYFKALEDRLNALERSNQLNYASIEGGSLDIYDEEGTLKGSVGVQPDGGIALVPDPVNTEPPPTPSAPVVTAALAGLVIDWDGRWDDAETVPSDFVQVQVHVGPAEDFTPTLITQLATITDPTGGTATVHVEGYAPVWVRLVAQNTASLASDPSTAVQGTPRQAVSQDLIDGIVTDVKLAEEAVTAAKLAAGAVESSALADGAVLAAKLAANAVTQSKLATGAVTELALADSAVTAAKVAAAAIDSAKLADLAVTAQKIGDQAVTTAKVATGAIDSTRLADGAVLAAKLAANAVTLGKIADGAVNDLALANSAVTAAKVAAAAIDSTKIADAAVTAVKIGAAAVTAGKLAAQAVTLATLSGALADTASQRWVDTMADPSAWTTTAVGTGATFNYLTGITDAPTGQTVGQAAGTVRLRGTNQMPYDPDVLYRISARVRMPQASTSDAVYVGVAGIAADGVTLVNRDGTNSTSTQYYPAAAGRTVANSDGWVTVVGFLKGRAATGVSGSAGPNSDPRSPGLVHANVRFIAPYVWLDYSQMSAPGAPMQIDYYAIEALKTGVVDTINLASGAVTAPAIAADAVIAGKVAADAITARELAANSVTAAELSAGSVTAAAIAAGTITAGQLAANSVTATQLAAGSVQTAALAADAVAAGKVAADAITARELAANSVTAMEISAGAVTATALFAGAVTTAALAADAVAAGKVAADAITARELAANSVTAAEIAAGVITAAHIAANTITAGQLAANSVTAASIAAGSIQTAALATDAVAAGKVAADAITARELAANSVTATEISAGSVTATAMAANSVTAGSIAAGAVTTAAMTAGSIQGDRIAAGTLNADKIVGSSITTAQLAALSVTAAQLAANSVTATAISAGAVTATAISAGSIDATHIKAGSISADRLAIGSSSNMLPDPSYEGAGGAALVAGQTFWTIASTGNGSAKSAQVNAVNATAVIRTLLIATFPVFPGQQFRLATDVNPSTDWNGASVRIYARWIDSAGGVTFGFVTNATPTKGSWTNLAGTVTAPAGTVTCEIRLASYDASLGTVLFDNTAIQPVMSDVLIADGAITAAKLDAAAINGKTITGVTITGTSTITGATVQTATTGKRAVLTPDGNMSFYTAVAGEESPAAIYVNGTAKSMELAAPRFGGRGAAVSLRNTSGTTYCTIAADLAEVVGSLAVVNSISAGNIKAGRVSITPSAANTPTSVTVTGLDLGTTTPRAVATPSTTVPGSQVTGVGCTGLSSDSVTIWVTRINTTATNIDYFIFGA